MSFSIYLTKIAGVSIYPVVSLALFVTFFISVTIWVYRISKHEIERMEQIPFDEN